MNLITINGEQVEVSDELLEKIKREAGKDIISYFESYKDFVGNKWYIRTVTYHSVGKIVKIVGSLFMMEQASWVADSGRFMQAIKEGKLDEVEPVGKMFLAINSIIDIFPWNHNLPTEQK
jgi:hypothetical protein